MLSALLRVVIGVLVVGAAFRIASLVRPHPFPSWMTPILELSRRRRDQAIERTGIAAGMRILEVGPGAGYLTEAALDRAGPMGRLVCLDIQPEMLRKVRTRLGPRAPSLVCASGSELPFRSAVFDLVFLVSVLGEIPDKEGALREYARVLRPGTSLAVTENIPDPDYVRTAVLRRLATRAGLEPRERTGNWLRYTHRFVRPAVV